MGTCEGRDGVVSDLVEKFIFVAQAAYSPGSWDGLKTVDTIGNYSK